MGYEISRFTLTLHGDLYKSPVKNPQSVLDLGTGTGIWAIDMAEYDTFWVRVD